MSQKFNLHSFWWIIVEKAGKQAVSAPTEKEVNEWVYISILIQRRNTFIPFDTISPNIPDYSRLSHVIEESERAQTGYT